MPAVKAINPKQIFSAAKWAELTRISEWKGLALVVHAWAVISLASGITAILWHWHWLAGLLVAPIAIAVIGGRQLGLAILMHDAAHGVLHPKRRINNFWGDWFAGAATGADLQSYRAYHLAHHRYTQQAEDPDLSLSSPFPVSADSLRRKIIRDLTGQTFLKQRAAQLGAAWMALRGTQHRTKADGETGQSRTGISAPVVDRAGARQSLSTVTRFIAVQLAVALVSLVTIGWIGIALWFIALATSFQLFLRIRNIAEHACTTSGGDDPFSHARTTYANIIERALVAPYWVNYHIEHHMFMGIPCYNLPAAHGELLGQGYAERMTIAAGYSDVLKQVQLRSA